MNATIAKINSIIESKIGIENAVLFGVAEAVLVNEGEGFENVLPQIIDPNGECHDVLFDDANNVSLYHRLNSKSYVTSRIAGFGDTPQRSVVYDMSMVVYGKRTAIDFMRLEHLCVEAIENVAIGEKTIQTDVIATNFNRIAVFQSEYVGLPFPIQPDIFLFKINYKLTRVQSPCH